MSTMYRVFDFIPSDIDVKYLVLGGSHLYGTSDSSSDTDCWGICNCLRPYVFTTGGENKPNSKDDIEILLYPEDEFIRRLKSGDMRAIDLLFSYTLPQNIVMGNICYIRKFIPYLNWSSDHVVKYVYDELKGYPIYKSTLWKIREILDILALYDINVPIWSVLDEIIVSTDTYTYKIGKQIRKGIQVLDKKIQDVRVGHATAILREMYCSRLRTDFRFKNMMHALRAIGEFVYYQTHGYVEFPLPGRFALRKIKQGFYPWYELIDRVNVYIAGVLK